MAFPSTFQDMQNEVIAKVRLDATADLQKAKDWINRVYADICVDTEAVQGVATMSLTANVAQYTLDAALLRIKQMYVTPSGQAQSSPLIPVSIEQILEWSASNGASVSNQGSVTHYAVLGIDQVYFYPTPQTADTITVYYVKLPTALSANADLPVLQEPYVTECLVNGASYHAAVYLKDPDSELFRRDYETARARFRGHLRRKVGAMTQQFRVTGSEFRPSDPSVDARGWYGA